MVLGREKKFDLQTHQSIIIPPHTDSQIIRFLDDVLEFVHLNNYYVWKNVNIFDFFFKSYSYVVISLNI